jgi:hypothetical protein
MPYLAPTKDDLVVLILAHAAQISALTVRVAELEAKLASPTEDAGEFQPAAARPVLTSAYRALGGHSGWCRCGGINPGHRRGPDDAQKLTVTVP